MIKTYTFKMNLVPKPRMTRSDKWKKRPATTKYWAFKDQIKVFANLQGLYELPGSIYSVQFYVAMPESWNPGKKLRMDGTPHAGARDLDNYLKALFDCLCKQDGHIYEITNGLGKYWATESSIVIRIMEDHPGC